MWINQEIVQNFARLVRLAFIGTVIAGVLASL
jgi:hypothetical protein